MGFWDDFLGRSPPLRQAQGERVEVPVAASAPPRRGTAAWHRDRFANALPQYRVALERGETTPERIAELERQHAYYSAIAAAEEAAGIPLAAEETAAQEQREEEIQPWVPAPDQDRED